MIWTSRKNKQQNLPLTRGPVQRQNEDINPKSSSFTDFYIYNKYISQNDKRNNPFTQLSPFVRKTSKRLYRLKLEKTPRKVVIKAWESLSLLTVNHTGYNLKCIIYWQISKHLRASIRQQEFNLLFYV